MSIPIVAVATVFAASRVAAENVVFAGRIPTHAAAAASEPELGAGCLAGMTQRSRISGKSADGVVPTAELRGAVATIDAKSVPTSAGAGPG